MLQIKNLRTNTENIHRDIFQLVLNSKQQTDIASIENQVITLKDKIEFICAEHNATPADMATPSFRLYLWLRFLSQKDYLVRHIDAVEQFTIALYNNKYKKSLNFNNLLFKINFSGYLYQRRAAEGNTTLQVNEGFISAPKSIKDLVISAAFAKRRGKQIIRIREFTGTEEFIKMNAAVSGTPICNKMSCIGQKYDLAIRYNSINKQYFSMRMEQPRLIWSSSRAKLRLGYYHPEIHTIAINKKLDNTKTPRLLIDYVLYHEMLHQYFGIEHRNGRRYAHTSAFHKAEKQFAHYQEAENLIKLLQ